MGIVCYSLLDSLVFSDSYKNDLFIRRVKFPDFSILLTIGLDFKYVFYVFCFFERFRTIFNNVVTFLRRA